MRGYGAPISGYGAAMEWRNGMTDKERKDIQKALLYDLRLLVKRSEKEQYTKDELLDFFDTIAAAKEQE